MNYKNIIKLGNEIGIEELEVFATKSESKEISMYNRQIEKNVVSNVEKVAIRGAYQGKLATVSTENISMGSAREMLELLKDNCTSITSDEPYVIYEGSKRYPRIKQKPADFSKVDLHQKITMLYELHDELLRLEPRLSTIEVEYSEDKTRTNLVNSKGLNLKKESSYGFVVCSLVLEDAGDTRDEFAYQVALDYSEFDVKAIAQRAVKRLRDKMNPEQIETGEYPIILENQMVISLLGAFTSMFSSEAALRNMTLLKGKEGQKIASPLVTLIDDPLYENGIYKHTFDNQGVACFKKNVINKGVFKTLLYDLKTAKMFNVEPTGNSFGSIQFTNLRLECGKSSFDEMVSSIDKGLLITSLQGLHSGLNPVSGDFSCQASGLMIENGKITFPVSLIVVSGNFLTLLNDVEMVGNDEFVSYNGTIAPSIKIKSIAISGK